MTYELALKLKEAGFPQIVNDTGVTFFSRGDGWTGYYLAGNPTNDDGKDVKLPTLSELIRECGKYFDILGSAYHPSFKWNAFAWYDAGSGADGRHVGQGNTPEEAVANLWLKLHGK